MSELDEHISNIRSIRCVVEELPGIDLINFEHIQPLKLVQDMWTVIKKTMAAFSSVTDFLSSRSANLRNEAYARELNEIFGLVNANLGNMESRADTVEIQLLKWLDIEGGEVVENTQLHAASIRCIVHKILLCYNEVMRSAVNSSEKLCVLLEKNNKGVMYGRDVDLYS